MTTPTIYTIRRGQTVTLFVEAVTGDPSVASAPVCKIKPINSPIAAVPDSSVSAVLTLTPVYTPASGSINAGWTIALTQIQTAGLAVGFYMADFACTIAGGEVITEPVVLQLVNAVSVP